MSEMDLQWYEWAQSIHKGDEKRKGNDEMMALLETSGHGLYLLLHYFFDGPKTNKKQQTLAISIFYIRVTHINFMPKTDAQQSYIGRIKMNKERAYLTRMSQAEQGTLIPLVLTGTLEDGVAIL